MGIHKENVSISEISQLLKDNVMANLNCHNIGKIIDFDSSTQTCTVELMQIKQYNDNFYTPAPITQVPLIILGAGGGHITMPNPVGTICLILFLDRNIDNFMETGEQYVPETSRMHDFTDAIALTTFTTLANPLTDYDEDAVTLFNEGLIDNVNKLSSVKIYPDKIEIQAADGANITASDKVSISNSAQDLGTLIKKFLTACESITTVNGGGLTDASKQLFTNLKSQFAALLEENNNV